MLTYKSALDRIRRYYHLQGKWLRSWNTSFGNVQISHEIVPNFYSLFLKMASLFIYFVNMDQLWPLLLPTNPPRLLTLRVVRVCVYLVLVVPYALLLLC